MISDTFWDQAVGHAYGMAIDADPFQPSRNNHKSKNHKKARAAKHAKESGDQDQESSSGEDLILTKLPPTPLRPEDH